jgi:hypothetical protein
LWNSSRKRREPYLASTKCGQPNARKTHLPNNGNNSQNILARSPRAKPSRPQPNPGAPAKQLRSSHGNSSAPPFRNTSSAADPQSKTASWAIQPRKRRPDLREPTHAHKWTAQVPEWIFSVRGAPPQPQPPWPCGATAIRLIRLGRIRTVSSWHRWPSHIQSTPRCEQQACRASTQRPRAGPSGRRVGRATGA